MPIFFVRVELHGGVLADYTKLHQAMEKAGFSRTVEADDGKKYNLPTAEYSVEGTYTLDQVLNAADTAAKTTGKTHIVLASISSSWKSRGMTVAS